MKKALFVVLVVGSLAAPVGFVSASGGQDMTKFGIRIMPGYSTSVGGTMLDTAGDGAPVYLSNGAGLNFQVEFDMDIGKFFQIGLETGYWKTSKTTSYSDWSSTYPDPSTAGQTDTQGNSNYSSTWAGNVIPLRLWLRGLVPLGPVRLFAGASIGYYLPGSLQDTYSYDNYSVYTFAGSSSRGDTYYNGTATYSLKANLGFAGEVGVDIPLGSMFGLTVRTRANLVNFWPTQQTNHYTYTSKSTFGGTTTTTQTGTYDWTTTYVNSFPFAYTCTYNSKTVGNTTTDTYNCGQYYNYTTTNVTNPGNPSTSTETGASQQIAQPLAGSTFSFEGGIYFRF